MKPVPGKIVIFGQYKSGTTALFSKVKNSLPGDTRLLFEPLTCDVEPGDAERWVLSKTILKFPGHPQPVDYAAFMGFERKIYLVRDPRDWLVSATLFLPQEKESIYGDSQAIRRVLNYLQRKQADPGGEPLGRLLEYILSAPPAMTIEAFAQRTANLHAWCMGFGRSLRDAFRFRYEDMVQGLWQPLEGYLELPLSGSGEVDPGTSHVVRSKAAGSWKNWLTAEDADFFAPYFRDYIHEYAYLPEWELNAEPVIDPAHGSDYVKRVVERKRKITGID